MTASAWLAGQAWLCCCADFLGLPQMRGHQLLSADHNAHGFEDCIVPLDVPFALHIQSGVWKLSLGEWSVLRGYAQDTYLQLVFTQAFGGRVSEFCSLAAQSSACDTCQRSVLAHYPPTFPRPPEACAQVIVGDLIAASTHCWRGHRPVCSHDGVGPPVWGAPLSAFGVCLIKRCNGFCFP